MLPSSHDVAPPETSHRPASSSHGSETEIPSNSNRIVTLYIASPQFSGSTLLCILLGSHPQIVTAGEMVGPLSNLDPKSTFCSCGSLVTECSFWSSLRDEMERAGQQVRLPDIQTQFITGTRLIDRARWNYAGSPRLNSLRDAALNTLWFGHHQRLVELSERNLVFIRSALRVGRGAVFLDASKDSVRISRLRRIPELDMRVIHLMRDPRSSANSFRKNNRVTVREGARTWRRHHERVDATVHTEQLPSLTIKYEDLCARPEATLAAICRFGGVDPALLPPTPDPDSLHVFGNRMRMSHNYIPRLDTKWRNELTQSDLKAIHEETARLGERYGYPVPGDE